MGYDSRLARTGTHIMCCICFEMRLPEELFVDTQGQKWDVCAKSPCPEQAGIR